MDDYFSKRAALFSSLDDASKELKGTGLDQSDSVVSPTLSDSTALVYRNRRNRIVHSTDISGLVRMNCKESIFKRPGLPIARCLKPRKKPDYQINPHKWQKYSLSEVDISDRTNAAAAFVFLSEIDEHRESRETPQEASANSKVEFKKSSKIKRFLKAVEANEVRDAQVDKPKLRGSKLIMPEYVIGQKKDITKKQVMFSSEKRERAAGGILTLAHLQEMDDDDIDNEVGEE